MADQDIDSLPARPGRWERFKDWIKKDARPTDWAIVILTAGLVLTSYLQWKVIQEGSKDTHNLASAAGKQADNLSNVSDAANTIKQAAQDMVIQDQRIADNAEASARNTLAEMRKQTSAQRVQSALAQRQDVRTEEQLAAHLVVENFNVDYTSGSDPPKTTVSFDVFNDGGSSATELTRTQSSGGFSPQKTFEDNFSGINAIPKRTDPVGGTIPKGERRHFTTDADWIAMRNGRTPLEWFAWWRFTYLKEPGQEGETDSLCVLATGSKHGISQRSCNPPDLFPPLRPKGQKGK